MFRRKTENTYIKGIYILKSLQFFTKDEPQGWRPGRQWRRNPWSKKGSCLLLYTCNLRTSLHTWNAWTADLENWKDNPEKKKVLHVAACRRRAVVHGVRGRCKLQWEWVTITDLWTEVSLMVTPSIDTKGTASALLLSVGRAVLICYISSQTDMFTTWYLKACKNTAVMF